VWLASIALRDERGEIIATGDWTPEMQEYGDMQLRTSGLGGVGDASRQRCFRMNITRCLHRAVTKKELRVAPAWWHESRAVDIAGAPVEVLWSVGLPDTPSARPCANPGHQIINPTRPDLWVPEDCGVCLSCQARAAQNPKGCRCALCMAREEIT